MGVNYNLRENAPDIELQVYYTDKPSRFQICYGKWSGGSWSVYINRYYYGWVMATAFGWQNDIRICDEICPDDIPVIIAIVKEHHGDLIMHDCCR